MIARRPLTNNNSGGNYGFSEEEQPREFIPTGSKLLDLSLGGGWAEHRLSNVIGDMSTGKTLLMIEAAANFIIKYPDGIVRYRETEAAFDKGYAAKLGLPIERVDFGDKQIHTVEDLYRDLDKLTSASDQPELYIIDSLDAISSRAEMERDIDADSYAGEKARKMSELFRRLGQSFISDELHIDRNMTLLIVSQIRDRIGIKFGRKWTRAGGKAIDFYASIILILSQLSKIDKTIQGIKRTIGIQVKVGHHKNKINGYRDSVDFPLLFGFGVDDRQACLDWLKQHKVKDFKDHRLEPLPLPMLHEAVEEKWWAIEKMFAPKTKKYNIPAIP